MQSCLKEPAVTDCEILDYCKLRAGKYPVISITRDYLAVQAASVESEREFSKAKNVIADVRIRLGSRSTRATEFEIVVQVQSFFKSVGTYVISLEE
jgi:hAT family C-terminal dimerisation region